MVLKASNSFFISDWCDCLFDPKDTTHFIFHFNMFNSGKLKPLLCYDVYRAVITSVTSPIWLASVSMFLATIDCVQDIFHDQRNLPRPTPTSTPTPIPPTPPTILILYFSPSLLLSVFIILIYSVIVGYDGNQHPTWLPVV